MYATMVEDTCHHFVRTPAPTLKTNKLFIRPHSNCNQHANSFFPWSIKHWNKLPGSIVDIEDKFKFKTAVCDHLVELGEWF